MAVVSTKFGLIALFLFSIGSTHTFCNDSIDDTLKSLVVPKPTTFEFCPEAENCVFPLERLSHQNTSPFLSMGRDVINEMSPKALNRPAIKKFPSVTDCLRTTKIRSEGESSRIFVFDWSDFRNPSEVEVCLFRIAESINDVELFTAWLVTQGITFKGTFELTEPFVRDRPLSVDDRALSFGIGLKNNSSLIVKQLRRGPAGRWPYGMSLSVFFGKQGNIKSINLGFSSL